MLVSLRSFAEPFRAIAAHRARVRGWRAQGRCEICGNAPRVPNAAECGPCYIDRQAW